MFASFFYCPHGLWMCVRAGALALVLAGATQAVAASTCKPILAVRDVRFSEIHLETMLRKWTATVSVDASRCATQSGRFEILFTRAKENAPEIDFVEPFVWTPGIVDVSVDFWADEAVEGYRLGGVAACPCRE